MYNARVRSCALLLECLTPPSTAVAANQSRLRALDTMADNMLLSADARWRRSRADACAAEAELAISHDTGVAQALAAAEAKSESALLSIVLLHAARVHLHRKACFPELVLDFESCSFRPVPQLASSDEGEVERDPGRVAESLQKISNVSDA